ncbi:MAG: hypothetical protein FD135_2281 [Comamonadaceae bacterium]|nr:MAG: hypothetical protein FD135_2281 [Comamonadaceae bacterium]
MGAGLVLRQAYATGSYSLKEIGQAFGLHDATVSRLVRAAEVESVDGNVAIQDLPPKFVSPRCACVCAVLSDIPE